MMANAAPQSSRKETHWPFTLQWTLGAQPLEACVARPVKETFKSGGAGIQSQQLFLQTDGSQHNHSLFKVKSHRGAHSPTHCKSVAGRLHLQRSPSAPGQPVLANANSIRQTGGRKQCYGDLPKTHRLTRPNAVVLWPHDLAEGYPRGHTVTRDRRTECVTPGSCDRGKMEKGGCKNG